MTRLSLAAAVMLLAPLAACGSDTPAATEPDPGDDDLVATVFVGDSITRGVSATTLAPDDDYSWVTHVVADERSPWELIVKVSVFGRTLGEMQEQFAAEVLIHDPDGVVLMGGTNDALRRLPVEQSTAALRAMVLEAQDAGAEVWVVSPPPLDPSYDRPLAPLVDAERALAEELDVPFVDVSTALAGDDGRWLPGLSNDGVHPTVEGAQQLADLVLDELGR